VFTKRNWPRSTALILMIVAAVFWLWFGIGSAAYERLGAMNWVMHIVVPGGVFVFSTLLALRRPQLGGAVLVVEGLLALVFVLRASGSGNLIGSAVVLMLLTLALPPLAAGALWVAQARGWAGRS
jgi:hypothetical protein